MAASRKRRYRPEEDLSRGSGESEPKPRGREIAEFFEVFRPKATEGAGKRRIFAIGNSFNQRLLRPVHLWFASVLKRIPMDGTFNQTAPRVRLIPSSHCFSFDLKSATDRWSLLYLFEIVALLFDRSFASSVVNSTLATNLFEIPFVRRYSTISFVAGQPLGYYGSWPLVAPYSALSNHQLAPSFCRPSDIQQRS